LAVLGGPYFLAKPRRFGKSLFIITLESIILGKKELTDLDKNIISKYLLLRFEIDINKVSIPTFKMSSVNIGSLSGFSNTSKSMSM
jgi:hypothetical protein